MKKLFLTLLFAGTSMVGLAQESYSLSAESTLAIDGSSTIHDWTVTANAMEGETVLGGSGITGILFEVPVADIHSERGAAMDKKMHEALKKEEHPNVKFAVKEAKISDGGNQEITGLLTIAGVEKEVSIPSKIEKSDGKVHISGEKKIILQDFEMEPPTAMFGSIVVGDEVTVRFDLMFAKD